MNGPGDKLRNFMNKFIKSKNSGNVTGGRDTNKALEKLRKKGLDDPIVANKILYESETPTVEALNQQMTQRTKDK